MKRLSICVDIDGTITDPFYWVDDVNQHFNKSIKPEEITTYNIPKAHNISDEAFLEYYMEYGAKMHLSAKIREGAAYYLQELHNVHNIYYVTARMSHMNDVTEVWFNKYSVPFKEIYYLGSHDKLNKAQELNCDIFIEDRLENALQLSEAGIEVYLVDCPYNQFELNDKIIRVNTWEDIYNEVNKRFREW